MTDDIQTLIAGAPILPRKNILTATEEFINAADLHKYTTRIQEVGAIRRGEGKARAIELLIVPLRLQHHPLERFLTALSTKRDLTSTDAWRLIWKQIPVILHLATRETFVARQLITTGPEEYARLVQNTARDKGYRLDQGGFHKGDPPAGGLIVPFDEAEILETIGLPYVPPQERAACVKELKGRQS